MARVKGTAVQSSLRYVKERFGQAALARILARLDPSDRDALDQGVLTSSWYPMDLFLHFMRETQRQLGAHRGEAVCRFEASWA